MRFPEYPQLSALTASILEAWPQHEAFIAKRFAEPTPAHMTLVEKLSDMICTLGEGQWSNLAADYRWTCEMLLEEELHFRRSGGYRYTTFAEAEALVYSDTPLMTRYINGLLVTQVLWANHTGALKFFIESFLGQSKPDYRLLEIGPGHGLFLYFAATQTAFGHLEAWDVSAASIASTRHALQRLGVEERLTLRKCDLFDGEAPETLFDCAVMSEVLEHLENPLEALQKVRGVLAPGGRIFINAPCNSPAPDHLYLFESPEHISDLVAQAGFSVLETAIFPLTGYSEERARKAKLTLSCAVIGEVR